MKKIMLVDDVEISNFIMKKLISRVEGEYDLYDYTLPASGIEALEKVDPDLIFLDLNMPLIDGWAFLDLMKEKKCDKPVYILTSSTSPLDLNRSKDYNNVKDFLVKPINLPVLDYILHEL